MIVHYHNSTDLPVHSLPTIRRRIEKYGEVAVLPYWPVEDFSELGPSLYIWICNALRLRTASGWPKWLLDAQDVVDAGLSLMMDDRKGTLTYEIAKHLWPDTRIVKLSETVCADMLDKALEVKS